MIKKADAVAGFAAVLEHPELHDAVERLCQAEWGWSALRELRVTPLRSHRLRCTFEVALRGDGGWRHVIGKTYATDRADVFAFMRAVERAGFGADAELSIPRPLAYFPELRARLEERLAGEPATELLLSGPAAHQVAVARRCGAWLARFHSAAPREGATHDLDHALARCRRWTDEMAGGGGEGAIGRDAQGLFRALAAGVPATDPRDRRAGHGSYIPDHVLLSSARTAVIDLDEYDAADPARDVAWFMVSVRRRAMKRLGDFAALDHAAEAFREAYLAQLGGPGPRALAHLPFYLALECLHRGARDFASDASAGRSWAVTMIREGLRALS